MASRGLDISDDGYNSSTVPNNITTASLGIIKNISVGLIAAGIGTTTGQIMAPLAKSLAGLGDLFGDDFMTIDTDKFAEAFKFDMDQDELSRLMESMMSSTSEKTKKTNLISLGSITRIGANKNGHYQVNKR